MQRSFRFVPFGSSAPHGSLAVDAGVAGAAATYSHWQGAQATPPQLLADTSTGILVRAAGDPRRWLDAFPVVCNNHIDADGLLAAIFALRPELVFDHGAVAIAAAEAGDFCEWPGEAGFRLMLRLHQELRNLGDRRPEGTWEESAYQQIIAEAPRWFAEAAESEPERDAEVARVAETIRRLSARHGFSVHDDGRLLTIAWTAHHGHPSDQFSPIAVGRPDDLPVWAIHGAYPGLAKSRMQLLAMATPSGTHYRLEGPRHAWARTVDRPAWSAPALIQVAERLQSLEQHAVQWICGASANRLGMTCVLAVANDAGEPAGSSISVAEVIAEISAGHSA
ncbi:hypothetical protein LBMAG53_12950 [Planctomycetota bacterium]|nr:hypothetical protein LBMAG53_12950 [Planctomycetota bacterium]